MKLKLWTIIGEKDGQRMIAKPSLSILPALYERKKDATTVLRGQHTRKVWKMRVTRATVTVEVEQ